jgi:DNA-binding NarL/FixJ family response regulator
MKPRILVVDDDPLYVEAAATVLSRDGRVDVVGRAADGREAVERALALCPDVVLMDINMPILDGIEATRRLRRSLPSTRVVIVSASTSPDDRRRALEAGAFASIAKAPALETLAETAVTAAVEAVAP